jgi:hypothetical protein
MWIFSDITEKLGHHTVGICVPHASLYSQNHSKMDKVVSFTTSTQEYYCDNGIKESK